MTSHASETAFLPQCPSQLSAGSIIKCFLIGLVLVLSFTQLGTCQLLSCSPGPGYHSRYDWSFQFRGSQSRVGFQECEDAITLAKAKSQNLEVVWSDPAAYFTAGDSTPAIVAGNSLPNTTADLYIASNWGGVAAYDANGVWGNQGAGLATCPPDPNDSSIRNCGPYWQNYNLPDSLYGSSAAAYVVNINGTMRREVFFAGDRGISAMDAATGKTLWSGSFGSQNLSNTSDITSAPLYNAGTVYVGATDGYLYAFDATVAGCPGACIPKWKSATLDSYKHSIVSSPTLVYGNVGQLIAVGDKSNQGPDYGGFTLYYADDNNLNHQKGGTVYWRSPSGFGQVISTPLLSNGKLYVISSVLYATVKWTTFYNTYLYAIDPNAPGGPTASKLYQLNTFTPSSAALEYQPQLGYCDPNNCHTPPDLYDILYVASGSQIYGFDLQKSGLLSCTQTLGYTVGWSSPATAANVLFIGGSDGAVHGFDTTGCKSGGNGNITEVWSKQLSNQQIDSSPVIANGTLFVNTQSGLFAIK